MLFRKWYKVAILALETKCIPCKLALDGIFYNQSYSATAGVALYIGVMLKKESTDEQDRAW